MLNSEKQDKQRSEKLVEKLESELTVLRKDKERLQGQVAVYEKELIDLKEQVDAALGAEEMVEQLTERNLKLEDDIREILEEKNDLVRGLPAVENFYMTLRCLGISVLKEEIHSY